MKTLLKRFLLGSILSLSLLSMTGCNQDSTATNEIPNVTGTFIDAPVKNLNYRCSSGASGATNINGEYTCKSGDDVIFSIGDLVIGTIAAQETMITPYTLFPNDTLAALNLARLLQSLDSDADGSNGLDLNSSLVVKLAANSVAFGSSYFETIVQTDLGITLVSLTDAQNTMNSDILSAGGTLPISTHTPVAKAGMDKNIETGVLVTLDANASSDGDFDPLTYQWSMTFAPVGSSATLSSSTAANPSFIADVNGTYIFELIVNDGTIDSAKDTVVVNAVTMTDIQSFTMPPLDVDQVDATVLWKLEANVTTATTAAVKYQGSYGVFSIAGDFIHYIKTKESNQSDIAVIDLNVSGTIVERNVTINVLYWKQVSAGTYHTAAIKSDGTLWLWGQNVYGQLGDGSLINKLRPVQEVTKATNWSSVSQGFRHTVALKSDGTLWSWGLNSSGQLGDGSNINRSTPTQESTSATDWSSVIAGYNHCVALKSDGTLWSWGLNSSGQLGDGSNINRSTATQESTSATDWNSISAGDAHTVAIKSNATLWAWGSNSSRQLGDGAFTDSLTPIQEVTLATNWSGASAGYAHTLALKNDGSLWSWGNNSYGELGDGTTTIRSIPTQEATLATNWNSISAGFGHTVALKNDGSLWSWGDNSSGQLGNGTTTNSSTPIQEITLAMHWSSRASGAWRHTVALTNDGTLWVWGANNDGELGDGTTTNSWTPILPILRK